MSHPLGKMRSVPKGAHNKRTRAVLDGGLRRPKVWLVTAAGGGKRGGEHNNQPKKGHAGCRAPKGKDSNDSEGGGNCVGEGDGGSVCCGEVRGNGRNDKDDDDDSCRDVGGGCGDGDSGGKGD